MSENEHNDSTKDTPVRKRVSLVWQYFEKLSNAQVKCRICQHEQRYMGNTANALRHLKAKHEIDARPVGLQDPENVKRMKELNVSAIPFEQAVAAVRIKNECRYFDDDMDHDENGDDDDEDEEKPETKPTRKRAQTSYFETETDVDPYVNNEEHLVDFVDTNNFNHHNKDEDDEEESYSFNRSVKPPKRKRNSLEDERIIAETDYFREKAAYFRVQKHLAALQARKVKFELDQLQSK